jgi:hypothetical protein
MARSVVQLRNDFDVYDDFEVYISGLPRRTYIDYEIDGMERRADSWSGVQPARAGKGRHRPLWPDQERYRHWPASTEPALGARRLRRLGRTVAREPVRGHCRPGPCELRYGVDLGAPMTQQYLIGQLSVLLEELQPSPGDCLAADVQDLRREVECSPLQMLPELAGQALALTDTICWAALDRGDASAFARYAKAALALGEFTDAAGLSPE